MEEIRLQRSNWFYDPAQPLGPAGGFGEVFAGQSADGQRVAIKRLRIDADASAHRELRIASLFENQGASHIIPMYDSGEDANNGRYFVVMSRAEKSLETDIRAGRKFSLAECVDIVSQIAHGLSELNSLVHRDLKPGNILFHEGTWKIADFGIARFVEESTSLNTLKLSLTPHYAAPEQWQLERAEVATDLYALGCIAYQLIAGKLPFVGPREEDFRKQHLNDAPPSLPDWTPPKLNVLVKMLLRKAPAARPSLERVKQNLQGIQVEKSDSQIASPIAEAAARLEQKRAQEESASAQLRSKEVLRDGLASAGRAILADIMSDLRKRILRDAPNCEHDRSPEVTLGSAQISIHSSYSGLRTLPEGMFPVSKLDVVLAMPLNVVQHSPRYVWESALLYYRVPNSEDYRWAEISFMPTFNAPGLPPFSLLDNVDGARSRYYHADMAIGPGLHSYQIAFGPRLIDDEDEEEFLERWAAVFAAAAEGRLRYPTRLPLAEDYWRNLRVYGI
jgi:serine/threonine-protein kinase